MDFSIDLKSLTVGRDRDSFFKSANKSSSEAVSSGTCALSENDSVSEGFYNCWYFCHFGDEEKNIFVFFFLHVYKREKFYLNAIGESTDN